MRDYALGTTFDIKFTTRRFSTGAPYTLAGSPAVAAYVDNDTTELTAGLTLSVDFDSRTGLNNVRVVASGGNGYAVGKNYALVLTAGTVDSVSVVGEVVGEFSIEAQSPLRPATDGRELVVDSNGLADATMVKVGPTGAATAQTAGDIIGDTNDIQARLPAALTSDGLMKADVLRVGGTLQTAGDIIGDTNDIQARLPAALTTDGLMKSDTLRLGGTLQTARDIGLSVLLSSGTGTGQLDFTSGVVKANVADMTAAGAASFFTRDSTKTYGDAVAGSVVREIAVNAIPTGIVKNAAFAGFMFQMYDTAGNPKTGLTITAEVALDGAPYSACTNVAAEVGAGTYTIDLAAADTNGNCLTFRFTGSGDGTAAQTTYVTVVTSP